MPVLFDVAANGSVIAGPTTDSLTSTWTHSSGEDASVILVGFQYNTNIRNRKATGHTITSGGHELTRLTPPMGLTGKGWGAPRKGWVEVWGGEGAAAEGGSISVNLEYERILDGFSAEHGAFTDFSGASVSYSGARIKPGFGAVTGRSAAGKLISVGLPTFMNALSAIFIGSDGAISSDVHPQATNRFTDDDGNLWVGDHRGPGTVRLENAGGNWGAVVVNLLPLAA